MVNKHKLKNAKLTSVDFVESGANQDADIMFFKSRTPEDDMGISEEEVMKSWWDKFKDFLKGETPSEEAFEKSCIAKAKQTIKDENQLYTSVLKESMDSIVFNDNLTPEEKEGMMRKSLTEFYDTMDEAIDNWSNLTKSISDEVIVKAQESQIEENQEERRGEEEMKIDKSRFTAEELATYEELIAKGKVEDEDVPPAEEKEEKKEEVEEEVVEKEEKCEKSANPIEKALHEEMEALRKNIADMEKANEMKEMAEIAKKYAPLGKKEEELAETLYEMKKSSQETYDQYVQLLDENLSMVEKSGMFAEIGKSGAEGKYVGSNAEAKIEAAAAEIRKSNEGLSYYEAVEKAWEENPELAAEYEREYMEGRK